MGVKISELSELTSAYSDDRLIINHYGTTYQGSLENITKGFLKSENLSGYLSNYITENYLTESGYITESYLVNNNYIAISDLSGYIKECIDEENYLSQNDLFNYLDENSYITESYLSENNYITEDYLTSNVLVNYVTSEVLDNYVTFYNLSDYVTFSNLSSYVTSDDLNNYLNENSYITEYYLSSNNYIKDTNFSDYLFRQSGYLSGIYNSDGTVNFEAIYQGISSYFET